MLLNCSLLLNKRVQKENQGFTLIECLIALMVLSSICFLFLPIINITKELNEDLNDSVIQEWHVFLAQLDIETKGYQLTEVKPDRLIFVNPETQEIMKIGTYETMIRKQLNDGHQPLLMHVKQAVFSQAGSYVKLQVTFLNDEQHCGYLYYPEK